MLATVNVVTFLPAGEAAHLRVAREATREHDLVHGPISFPVGRMLRSRPCVCGGCRPAPYRGALAWHVSAVARRLHRVLPGARRRSSAGGGIGPADARLLRRAVAGDGIPPPAPTRARPPAPSSSTRRAGLRDQPGNVPVQRPGSRRPVACHSTRRFRFVRAPRRASGDHDRTRPMRPARRDHRDHSPVGLRRAARVEVAEQLDELGIELRPGVASQLRDRLRRG